MASRRRRRRLHRRGAWRRRRLLGACRRSYAIGSVESSPISTRCSPCSIATFSRAQKKPGGQASQRGSSTRRGGGRHWEHASEVTRSDAWNHLPYPPDARPAQLQPFLARRRSQVGRPPKEVQRKVRRRQEGRSGAIKGTDHPTALPQVPLSAPAIAPLASSTPLTDDFCLSLVAHRPSGRDHLVQQGRRQWVDGGGGDAGGARPRGGRARADSCLP